MLALYWGAKGGSTTGMNSLRVRKVVLYKHGVGYFEREGHVDGATKIDLAFKADEVSDVLKSLTVLDLDGGRVSSISYEATTPAAKLLERIDIDVPEGRGLLALLPQLRGAEVDVDIGSERFRGRVIGVDTITSKVDQMIVTRHRLALMTSDGDGVQIDLDEARSVRLLDEKLRRDFDFFLDTILASKRKDARAFTIFAEGDGVRKIRASYTLPTPVWKASYRLLMPAADAEGDEPLVQGWAVVDNTQDEDWEDVMLSLVAGLPISFIHDLYSPRFVQRPVVQVQEQSAVAPPIVEESFAAASAAPAMLDLMDMQDFAPGAPQAPRPAPRLAKATRPVSSMPVQTRERQVGDLFEYAIEHPVTIRRNQSALVPIVLKAFKGRSVLLYNPATRERNPLSAVEFENSTGLTLEGGPVTVIEGDSYVGEAMIETIKPAETRLIPYSVELGVLVDSSIGSRNEHVHRTRIVHGILSTYFMERRKTVYTMTEKSRRARVLYLEHAREPGWDLIAPRQAFETTPGYFRFRFDLPANETTHFTVVERREIYSSYALANVTPETILDYQNSRYIDERVSQTLKAVLALKTEAAAVDARMGESNGEIGAITGDQQRIRENLKSIGEGHDEKRLRATLVEKLATQERRLEELSTLVRELSRERQNIQARIDATLGNLDFEANVLDADADVDLGE